MAVAELGQLDAALTGRRGKARQYEPVREALVVNVTGDGVFFRLLDQPQIVYGPARWQPPITGVAVSEQTTGGGDATHTHSVTVDLLREPPPSGTRCLVSWVGSGADRPWVVAFDRWPS